LITSERLLKPVDFTYQLELLETGKHGEFLEEESQAVAVGMGYQQLLC
jgi:hypothetical protein